MSFFIIIYIYTITHPPFGEITWPVVYLSSINNSTHLDMSIGCPILPSGISFSMSFNSLSVKSEFISVSTIPGAIELTLIPDGPNYLAKALVNPSMPALATL